MLALLVPLYEECGAARGEASEIVPELGNVGIRSEIVKCRNQRKLRETQEAAIQCEISQTHCRVWV